MFDKNKLKYYVGKNGKTLTDIALLLNVDKSTLWRKMNGMSDFSREDVQKIKEYLHLNKEEAFEIFFA